ncbi:FAD:protein FMN transferase [Acuticoccus kandeliae]|uniref:FAD:protein FMN transferase n=1 Tax=Acuticoccus kandeliae TaxID=2073160 RepID=UPI000D3E5FFF|nr:FAD:protein FMN transferase [Acuticoccus kandeliae]
MLAIAETALRFEATGTQWKIRATPAIDAPLARTIRADIERFEATFSRFRADSLVAKLAAAPDGGRFDFPAEAAGLFALYDALHAATGGRLDPLIGATLERLGYDRAYGFAAKPAPVGEARPSWPVDVTREGARVTTRRPLTLDFGAAGKGALVDRVTEALAASGRSEILVDAGGDMRHAGGRAIRVGLEDPRDAGRVIGVASLANAALCASAPNRRAWGPGLHHILDGRSGAPARGVAASWVVADSAAVADGVATALFLAAPDRLTERFRFEFVRLFDDGSAEHSPGFPGEIYF